MATMYVLLTPTWMSAMTGYQSLNTPMLRVNDTSYVNALDVPVCSFVVHDGHRVGLSEDACVPKYVEDLNKVTSLASDVSLCTSLSPIQRTS